MHIIPSTTVVFYFTIAVGPIVILLYVLCLIIGSRDSVVGIITTVYRLDDRGVGV
jgi:hypothetical protein